MAEQNMPEKLGRYTIIRELGKGAMGVVYEGKDPNIGRRVAIKTARRDVMEASGMADEMMERFLREAQAAGALNHPNIITIFDANEEDGIAYIAMEFLEGGDLQDMLEKRARLGEKEILELGATICDALAAAHDQGVVHRDIKPANIMVPNKGPIKLADFGIAHVSDSNLTQEGALIGTPHYMSPEQFMGQKVDGRSDLFSVGVILYEMLTGEKPFTGEALSTVMHHVIKTDPVAPSELNFAVSDATNEVVLRSLKKRPSERYENGRAMANALRECLKPKPDPTILATGMPAAEATVMGAAPAAADATVLGANPEATTLGTEAQAAGTVVSPESPEEHTMPAPGAMEDDGTPPPGASATEETIRKEAPGGSAPAVGEKPGLLTKRNLLVGAVALAVAFAVGIIALLPEAPYYSRFSANIYGTTDVNAWEKYNTGVYDEKHMTDQELWKQVSVDIQVKDLESGEIVGDKKNFKSGEWIPLAGHPKEIEFTFVHGTDEPESYQIERAPTDPDQIARPEKPFCILIDE